ncbi:hypothetical protein EAI_03732 [Harpegnathos saltator]|uniref:Uncharacterized protein n=1 Tax=Harpegnathos saltator TaxID=610380 RepID=E2BJV7_HARSA|nr:hypothetical protein EAI_03732 [Harpegnathos saltator]
MFIVAGSRTRSSAASTTIWSTSIDGEGTGCLQQANKPALPTLQGPLGLTSETLQTLASHSPEDAWKWSSESSGSQDDRVAPARKPSSQRTLGRRSANALGLRPSRSKIAKAPYGHLSNKGARNSEETVESLLRSRQRREPEIATRFEPLASTQQGVPAPPSTQQSL